VDTVRNRAYAPRMTYLKPVLLVALTLGALFFLIEAGILIRRVQMAVPGVADKLTATQSKLDTTLDDLDSTVKVAHDAAQKEAAYYDPARPGGLPQQVQRTIVDLKKLIGRTDLSLNGRGDGTGVLPALSATLSATSELSRNVSNDLEDTNSEIKPILADLATSSDALAKQTPVILASLSQSSENVVTITSKTAESVEEVRATTHDFRQMADKVREDFLKPVNRIKSYFRFGLDNAYKVRALFP
jgi:ABC-type transporter Mla subunit MlaD